MRKKDTAYNRQVLRSSNIWQTPYTTKSKLQFLSLEHTGHPRPLQMNEDSLVDVGRQSGKHSVCMLYDVDVCFNLCCLNLFESVWICLMFFSFFFNVFDIFSLSSLSLCDSACPVVPCPDSPGLEWNSSDILGMRNGANDRTAANQCKDAEVH